MPSLLLHASDPHWSPDELTVLVQSLRDLGLISAAWGREDTGVYRVGAHFLKLIMFLGCSPQVQLDPGSATDGQKACSIRFHVYPEMHFLAAVNSPAPRCRQCRTPVSIEQQPEPAERFTCVQCGEVSEALDLDWRQAAGFGRCFVEVAGVYPHEAVPSDKLLNALAGFSGTSWTYCYI